MRNVTVGCFVVVLLLMVLFLDQLPSQANPTDSVPAPAPEWARQTTLTDETREEWRAFYEWKVLGDKKGYTTLYENLDRVWSEKKSYTERKDENGLRVNGKDGVWECAYSKVNPLMARCSWSNDDDFCNGFGCSDDPQVGKQSREVQRMPQRPFPQERFPQNK